MNIEEERTAAPADYVIINDEDIAEDDTEDIRYDDYFDDRLPNIFSDKPILRSTLLNYALDELHYEEDTLDDALHKDFLGLAIDHMRNFDRDMLSMRRICENENTVMSSRKPILDGVVKDAIRKRLMSGKAMDAAIKSVECHRKFCECMSILSIQFDAIDSLSKMAMQDIKAMLEISENKPSPLCKPDLDEYNNIRYSAMRGICEIDSRHAYAQIVFADLKMNHKMQGVYYRDMEEWIRSEQETKFDREKR